MIRLFINKHMVVFSLSVLIVILGVVSYITLPRESSPEIKVPYIFISTSYIGVSASDIESLITEPIENELDGMEGLTELTSSSHQNISFITAEFSPKMDIEKALRQTKDRVDIAKTDLPDGAEDPSVQEVNISDWPIFTVVLSHPNGIGMITAAAENLSDELTRLSGALEVIMVGKPERELAIELNPYRMASFGISIDDVKMAISSEHVTIPGGVLENQEKNYTIAVTGEIIEPHRFGAIMVTSGTGASVRLDKFAHVKFQNAQHRTLSRLNGIPAISLSVKKRLGGNIIDLADAAHAKIEEITPSLPTGTKIYVSYDESLYIREMLADLENNMASGFILVLVVTIFFLGFRNSFFVSMAIPFSMLLSFFILQLLGITLNMIVLFSLIIALGMLVDNGIVIVENIFRHQMLGKSRVQAAIDGTNEVAAPIIASTITTLLAFFPIIFMPGMMGEFMSYLPKTVIIVLSSSLLVALCINPTYCASFLKVHRDMESGGILFTRVQNWYSRILERATAHGGRTVLIVSAIVIAGFVTYSLIAAEVLFFPDIDPERAWIDVEASQGTPLERTDLIVDQIEKAIPDVEMSMKSFQATAGRSSGDISSNRGEVNITFSPFTEREIPGAIAVHQVQTMLNRIITGAVVQVHGANSGPPSGDDISYEIRGDNYQTIGDITDKMISILTRYKDNFKIIENDYEADLPEISVSIDRQRAAHYGLNTVQIASTVRTAITGSSIGKFRYDSEEHDINIRYEDDTRDSLQMLRNINIVAPDNSRIPLSAVALIEHQSSVSVIKRRNLNRAVSVSANFLGESENRKEVTAAIANEVEELKKDIPPGYIIGSGSGSDIRNESTTFLIQAFLVAIFLILIVLIAQFNSLADPFIIIYAVFLSLGGVMWGFALGGQFGGQNFVIIMSGIGSIALAGVAVNNCIVLVDYTHKLIRSEKPWREAVILAGKTRLRPVLLTALTTILALIPMAVGVSFDIHTFKFVIGSESAEYWKSFAWTMLYGLTFATVTTLIVVPSLLSIKYRILDRKKGVVVEH